MGNVKKILLIDDEEDFCFFLKGNLTKTGRFIVASTTNPTKGIKIARRIRPDLILLDIRMPGRSGFEVLRALKKNEKTMSIPVIMLTAIGDDHTKTKASQLYNDDYIVKPVDYEDLEIRIDAVLRNKGS